MKFYFLNILFFINVVFLVFWNNPACAQPVVYADQIQKVLNTWRARSGIPGATVSLYLPGHLYPITVSSGTTRFGGYGNSINSNTLFQAGSITKSFTAMIILKLESEGKLNLTDNITNFLPQYPQWHNVTIQELLNHTSGIFNYTESGEFNVLRKDNPRQGFTPQQLVQMAAIHRDYFSPGYGWKYSNTNYVLAGMIIQKITGEPINTIMNNYLHNTNELALLNTYYLSGLYPSAFLSRMAHGYNSQGQDVTYDNMSWAYTAGAIITTTQDLLIWWHDLFQGNILPESELHQMMGLVCEAHSKNCRPGSAISHFSDGQIGHGYGLGIIESSWSAVLGPVWWHNGSTAGYKAIVMWFPKHDIYMALTINRDPGYLLNPDLPIVRNILSILIPNAQWHLAHPKKTHWIHHRITHHRIIRHKIKHTVKHKIYEHE